MLALRDMRMVRLWCVCTLKARVSDMVPGLEGPDTPPLGASPGASKAE